MIKWFMKPVGELVDVLAYILGGGEQPLQRAGTQGGTVGGPSHFSSPPSSAIDTGLATTEQTMETFDNTTVIGQQAAAANTILGWFKHG